MFVWVREKKVVDVILSAQTFCRFTFSFESQTTKI